MPRHEVATNNPVCLTDDEQQLLLQIYRTRIRFFASVFFSLMMLGIFYGQRIDTGGSKFTQKDGGVSRTSMRLIGITWLELPILSIGTFIFFKRIDCFRKDLSDGHKYPVYYTVINKLYFPLTDQYFISLDDPDYMHHEVDATIYQQVNVEDVFPVYNARYSRYAFNKNGSYTIL